MRGRSTTIEQLLATEGTLGPLASAKPVGRTAATRGGGGGQLLLAVAITVAATDGGGNAAAAGDRVAAAMSAEEKGTEASTDTGMVEALTYAGVRT